MYMNYSEEQLLPPDALARGRQLARDDWKHFLFSMCQVVGVDFEWFDDRAFDHLPDHEVEEYIERLQNDAPAIMVRNLLFLIVCVCY